MNYKGNITTIIKLISMPLAGAFIGLLIKYGIHLDVDQGTIAEIIAAIIMLGFGFMDAKWPHSFDWLKGETIEDVDPALAYDTIETNDAAGDQIDE